MRKFTDIIKFIVLVGVPTGCAAAVIFAGRSALPQGTGAGDTLLYVLFALVGIFAARFLHTLFHEGFHAVFGAANGFFVHSFSVGFLVFSRKEKGFKVSLKRGSQYAGTLLYSAKHGENLERRYIRIAAGGLIGSLIATLLYTLPLFFYASLPSALYFLLAAGLPVSAWLLLRNALPYYSDGVYNDGAVIAGVLQGDPSAKISVRLMLVQSFLFQGKSPGEIPSSYFEDVPVAADSDINKIQLKVFAYAHYFDGGNMQRADEAISFLQENLEYLPDIFSGMVLTDIFYHTLTYRKEIEKAADLYILFKQELDSQPNICSLRIRAAYELYVLQKPDLAAQSARLALAMASDYPLPGIAKMERRVLEELLKECAAAETSANTNALDTPLFVEYDK